MPATSCTQFVEARRSLLLFLWRFKTFISELLGFFFDPIATTVSIFLMTDYGSCQSHNQSFESDFRIFRSGGFQSANLFPVIDAIIINTADCAETEELDLTRRSL